MRRPPTSPLFPSTTLFRSQSPPRRRADRAGDARVRVLRRARLHDPRGLVRAPRPGGRGPPRAGSRGPAGRAEGAAGRRPTRRDPARAADRPPGVPAGVRRLKKKILDTWDGFLLPYPFTRGVFCWGDPLWVPRNLDATGFEERRRALEWALTEVTAQADAWWS